MRGDIGYKEIVSRFVAPSILQTQVNNLMQQRVSSLRTTYEPSPVYCASMDGYHDYLDDSLAL